MNFDPQYKNPCWHNEKGQLSCLPYVYIPGVLKCATSALYDGLEKHPSVKVSYPKETHWWTRNRLPFELEHGKPFHEQQWLINHAHRVKNAKENDGRDIILLEGSASMLWEYPYGGIMTMELVRALTPAAKFLVIVREPGERLYSGFKYFSYRTRFPANPETKNYKYTPEGFHMAVQASIKEMKRCFASNPSQVCAWEQRRFKTPVQIQLGMYSEFIETLLRFFPQEQLHVVRQEDLTTNPRKLFNEVTDFLGIDNLPDNKLYDKNGEMKKVNIQRDVKRRKTMWDKTRVLLNEFYAPFNRKLSIMLNDDKFLYGASKQDFGNVTHAERIAGEAAPHSERSEQ
jgi:N-acetylgalactosamine 4-sulfate 6-O-sulfotransferase